MKRKKKRKKKTIKTQNQRLQHAMLCYTPKLSDSQALSVVAREITRKKTSKHLCDSGDRIIAIVWDVARELDRRHRMYSQEVYPWGEGECVSSLVFGYREYSIVWCNFEGRRRFWSTVTRPFSSLEPLNYWSFKSDPGKGFRVLWRNERKRE